MNAISERISEAVRRAGGVSMVARTVGVTNAAIYHWQKGTQPGREALQKLANAASVPLSWLLGESDELPMILREESGAYVTGSLNLPPDLRARFARLANNYQMTEANAFRLLLDHFTGNLPK